MQTAYPQTESRRGGHGRGFRVRRRHYRCGGWRAAAVKVAMVADKPVPQIVPRFAARG